jgi:hypothetical protein
MLALRVNSRTLPRPDSIAGRKAQGLSKVRDGVRPKTLKAQKCFVGCLADLADSIQARVRQHVPYACGQLNVFDRSVIRQFRRRIEYMLFAHFPFAFSPDSTGPLSKSAFFAQRRRYASRSRMVFAGRLRLAEMNTHDFPASTSSNNRRSSSGVQLVPRR